MIDLEKTVCELLKRAETILPDDVLGVLEKALEKEDNKLARLQLETIIENAKKAREKSVPMCQDTGVPVFYVEYGLKSGIPLEKIVEGIKKGVKAATDEIPLRPNIVHPITRENTGNNTGFGTPNINIEYSDNADYVDVTVLPKGAGSENMSALAMLKPAGGVEAVKEFVVGVVRDAGGKPCPPLIVGVGLGGTADYAVKLAKNALLRPIGSRNGDVDVARLEGELLALVNALGVGPMGLGGKTTALAVNAEFAGCHTASLPVAVNIQCWAARVAAARIRNGKVEWLM
ncbi:MAG: fumarate hydratase [Candidatus Altiarchaeota archaeon]